MPRELTLHSGSALQGAKRWVDLTEAERKRRAEEALNLRDAATLVDLTISHLELWGKAGARVSRATTRSYACGVRIFIADTQSENLLRLKPGAAAYWIRSLEHRGLSPSTVSCRLAAVRSLYAALRWAISTDNKLYEHDPFKDVKPATDRTSRNDKRQPYSDSDIERLAAVAGPHDRALLYLGAHAGLRVAEILTLEWRDIAFDGSQLTVREGKGLKTRHVLMSVSLIAALNSLPRDSERVFPYHSQEQARARMRQLCRRAGVRYRAIHSLRHSAGSRLYRATGKLELCQRHLGHSNISTTQIYVAMSDDTLRASVTDW